MVLAACMMKRVTDIFMLSILVSSAKAFSPSFFTKVATPKSRSTTKLNGISEDHAREVFSMVDEDNSNTVDASELGKMLRMLDIDASDADANALFKYLDADGNGEITYEVFEPWYAASAEQAQSDASAVQSALLTRKSVDFFDKTPVSKEVLERAVGCAIASPSIGGRLTEHWRFIDIGPSTVKKVANLKPDMQSEREQIEDKKIETNERGIDANSLLDIPGWCVVTTKLNPGDTVAELEDYAEACCAIQSVMLSMWAEGIGTKWASGPVTRTKEFANLCGVDTSAERVVGCIWYGFARGGLASVNKASREKGVNDVLSSLA